MQCEALLLRRCGYCGTRAKLPPEQRACFVQPRPVEELYDLEADPYELHNLAGEPANADVLKAMDEALAGWQQETGDRIPAKLTPDEFDRETGDALPGRAGPRPGKKK